MSRISRHDAAQLLEKFKEKHLPAASLTVGELHILSEGARSIAKELTKETGPSSPLLRNYARVLKHFLDVPRGEDVIYFFNHITEKVREGMDPTAAIKRCRSTIDLEQVKRDHKSKVRNFEKSMIDQAREMNGGRPERSFSNDFTQTAAAS